MTTRRDRASETEAVAENFWQDLWAACHRKGMSSAGADLRRTPGVAIEVKATRGLDMMQALKQARSNAEGLELPVVMYRPQGYGAEKVDEWPCLMFAADLRRLLGEAHYGD